MNYSFLCKVIHNYMLQAVTKTRVVSFYLTIYNECSLCSNICNNLKTCTYFIDGPPPCSTRVFGDVEHTGGVPPWSCSPLVPPCNPCRPPCSPPCNPPCRLCAPPNYNKACDPTGMYKLVSFCIKVLLCISTLHCTEMSYHSLIYCRNLW